MPRVRVDIDSRENLDIVKADRLLALLGNRAESREEGEQRRDYGEEGREKREGEKEEKSIEKKMEKR
jgi:hypothetical protein